MAYTDLIKADMPSVIHEQDIPTMASKAIQPKAFACHHTLSFCVATSLAVAKRVTWEQTPWLNQPIPAPLCQIIATYVSAQLSLQQDTDIEIPWETVQNSILFGETYHKENSQDSLGTYPQLMVMFPHLTFPVVENEIFVRVWHDEIIRPAFHRAWEDSGLTEVYGSHSDIQTRSKMAIHQYQYHGKAAIPSQGIINHLKNGATHRVKVHWPAWKDFWGMGYEGKYTAEREKVFDDAWKSIVGMLKDHPTLGSEFRDPVLLVVQTGPIHYNPELGVATIHDNLSREWDKVVDSRYVEPGSFKITLETIIGSVDQVALVVDEEDRRKLELMQGVQFKRVVDKESKTGGSRTKRIR